MNPLSLFAFVIFAAETIISPIPEALIPATPLPPKPDVSFGQIVDVLGETITTTPTPASTRDESTRGGPTPTPPITKKKSYTIAFLGDSMIDTMGPGLPAVNDKLTATYPATNFTLLNFGVGGTNIDYGIERITNGYSYLGKQIPALT